MKSRFFCDLGQTSVEYALVAGIVCLGLALLLLDIGQGIMGRAEDGWDYVVELTGG